MTSDDRRAVFARHGETAWTLTEQHTGRTDIPLTEGGQQQAMLLGERLRGEKFGLVLTSPMSRAADTCRLAGFGDDAEFTDDLLEWDYGEYEGRRTADIRAERPDWSLWHDGVPGGERMGNVCARADRLIDRINAAGGPVLLFGHGHLLRILATCWIGIHPEYAAHLALTPGSISVLGADHGAPVILRWNDTSHLDYPPPTPRLTG